MGGVGWRRWSPRGSLSAPFLVMEWVPCGRTGFHGAAFAVAAGQRWVHEPVAGDGVGPRYSTQRRWLGQSARLLGLASELHRCVVERIVAELGLVGSEHAVLRRQHAASGSLVGRGGAVVAVLEQVSATEGLLSRVLAAGHLAGLWGHPWLSDVHTGQRFSPLSSEGRWRRGPPSVRG